MKKSLLAVIFMLFQMVCFGQQNMKYIEEKLEKESDVQKGLNEIVQTNTSDITLYNFITALSDEHKLNVSVDNALDEKITNNFYNVKVKDVFFFLIKRYNIDVDFSGGIIVLKKKEKVAKKKKEKKIDVTFNKDSKELSLNLKRDTLFQVAKSITAQSGINVIVDQEVKDQVVSGFIVRKPFAKVLSMLSKSNNLELTQDKEGFYYINKKQKKVKPTVQNYSNSYTKNKRARRNVGDFEFKEYDNGTFDLAVKNMSVLEIIKELAHKTNKSYFLYSDISDKLQISFSVKDVDFKKVLNYVFKGSKYTFKEEDGFYLIGEKNKEGLRVTELIKLKNRTVEQVVESIPSKIAEELEIKEFFELNGLVVSGHYSIIEELKEFLSSIDKNVPVVQIEVIIFQYEKSHDVQTGLKAGFDNAKQTSSLTNAFPTTDVNLNSKNVNKLINAFNGLGLINLGKVPSSFYLGLKALENNAIIKLESTPKIATLNGHEAVFKIGATDYYFEQTNRLITGGIGNDVLQSGQWRPTEANLSLKIKPFVSEDENVTLSILVEKSAFTGRVGETAPPSKSTQQFESLIRVKNGEMVLLGGLDEVEKKDSGTGTPFFSRIPVIKWLFSGRKKEKGKKKLHMFIKPTVFY